MIYGNKFYSYGIDSLSEVTELALNNDLTNFNNLLESFISESDSILKEGAIDKIFERMYNKLKDIVDTIILNVKKFINLAKSKMITLGNRIINKLDDVIAGKYEENDLKEIKDEVDKTFNDENNVSTVLNESESVVYKMYSPANTLDKFYNDIGTTSKEEQDFILNYIMTYIEKVRDYTMYTRGGQKESEAKEELYKYAEEYKENYRDQIVDGNIKIKDFITDLNLDFEELKSMKDNGDKTKHDLFTVLTTENKDKESLKKVRDFIKVSLKMTEGHIKKLAEYLNDEITFQSKLKKVEKTYSEIKGKWMFFEIGNIKPNDLLKELISEVSSLTTNQYKLYAKMMNILIYFTKVNYGVTLRCMNKWGDKSSSSKEK